MRPYRGLTKDGKWVYGNLIINNARESDGIHETEPMRAFIRERDKSWKSEPNDKCWTYLIYEVIPETVGQSTGFTDMNGKEIYKGDIMIFDVRQVGVWPDQCTPHVVEYPYICNNSYLGKIIGNVHDKPELKGKDNG